MFCILYTRVFKYSRGIRIIISDCKTCQTGMVPHRTCGRHEGSLTAPQHLSGGFGALPTGHLLARALSGLPDTFCGGSHGLHSALDGPALGPSPVYLSLGSARMAPSGGACVCSSQFGAARAAAAVLNYNAPGPGPALRAWQLLQPGPMVVP